MGLTDRTVYRLVQRGELLAEKPDGKPYRLRRPDVEAFIERSRVTPGELAHLRAREAKQLTGGTPAAKKDGSLPPG